MDIDSAIERYCGYLAQRNCVRSTVEDYRAFLVRFSVYLAQDHPQEAADIARIEYQTLEVFLERVRYRQDVPDIELAPATRAKQVNRLRSFGKYVQRKIAVRFEERENPFLALDRPRIPQTTPRAPEIDDLVRVLRQTNFLKRSTANHHFNPAHPYRQWMSARNKLIIYCFCITGIRLSELKGLLWGDIVGQNVVVRMGKGQKQRTIPIPTQLMTMFREFRALEVGRGRGWREQSIFWAHPMGRECVAATPIGTTGVRLIVTDVLRDKVEGFTRISPHMLRHAALSALVETGFDLITVAEISGHRFVEELRKSYVAPRDKRKVAAIEASEMNTLWG